MAIADEMIMRHVLTAIDRITRENYGTLDLSEPAQRHAICEYMRRHAYQLGLFGESITLGRADLFAELLTAFKTSDTAELGRVADLMFREYIASEVDKSL